MIDDALVLKVERLRDSVESLRDSIRDRCGSPSRPVIAPELRDEATQLGERWLVEVAARPDVAVAIGQDQLAGLNVEFQRLLTYAEQSTIRRKYESSMRAILRDFRNRIIVPLKQHRGQEPVTGPTPATRLAAPTIAFLGQSFAAGDKPVNGLVHRFLEAYGLEVLTGEKPKADTISSKIRERIERSHVFVGLFCRRDKISRRAEWTTSAWVIDEKAYAFARRKKLILLKEAAVQSIGGLQGDYEYLEFDRTDLGDLLVRILQVLKSLGPAGAG
jgi:hypothetical protein